jgi:hypothetical protein
VRDRATSNFCDFFRYADREEKTRDNEVAQKAREEWDRLFKKQEGDSGV